MTEKDLETTETQKAGEGNTDNPPLQPPQL